MGRKRGDLPSQPDLRAPIPADFVARGPVANHGIGMDSRSRRSQLRRASAFLESIERRDSGRHGNTGEIVLFWHHDPGTTCRYETIDVSGTGARIRTEAPLPEGMTGVALELQPGDVQLERAAMVVWSRGIRDADGRTTHHEAGIRFI